MIACVIIALVAGFLGMILFFFTIGCYAIALAVSLLGWLFSLAGGNVSRTDRDAEIMARLRTARLC